MRVEVGIVRLERFIDACHRIWYGRLAHQLTPNFFRPAYHIIRLDVLGTPTSSGDEMLWDGASAFEDAARILAHQQPLPLGRLRYQLQRRLMEMSYPLNRIRCTPELPQRAFRPNSDICLVVL